MLKPFERLRERLLAAGMSPRIIDRYMAELADHKEDLTMEEQRAGHDVAAATANALSRLGGVDDLADAMTARPALRSWTARAPWVIFVLAPPAAFFAVLALTALCMVLVVQTHRPAPDAAPVLPDGFETLVTALFRVESLILPILIGWGIAALAIRRRSAPAWPAAGLVAIAVIGAMFELSIILPSAGAHGEIEVGANTHASGIYRCLFNAALILLPYLAWRRRKQPIVG